MHTQFYNPVRLKRCFFNAEASSEFSAENFYRDFEFVAQAVGFLGGYLWTHRGFTQLRDRRFGCHRELINLMTCQLLLLKSE